MYYKLRYSRFLFSLTLSPSTRHRDEERQPSWGRNIAQRRNRFWLWFEERKIGPVPYVVSRTTCKVGLSLRPEFSVFCAVCWVGFAKYHCLMSLNWSWLVWFPSPLEGSLKVIVVCSYFFLPWCEVDTVSPIFLFSVLYQAASPAVVLKSLRWSRRNHRRPPEPQKPHPGRSNRHAKPRTYSMPKPWYQVIQNFNLDCMTCRSPGSLQISVCQRPAGFSRRITQNGKIKQVACGATDFA